LGLGASVRELVVQSFPGELRGRRARRKKLASLRDRRCKESEETIAAVLQGNYKYNHLFELEIGIELFRTV
jgi:hypothetical protein